MKGKGASFRVGKVRAYRRGKIWYLHYYEGGRRHRPRIGPERDQARQMAAQINGQLEIGAPAALSFDPVAITELRERWLEHHEHVRRTSVPTIRRYRAATEHLLRFLRDVHPIRLASEFRARDVEQFVRYLRSVQVAPNGHRNARTRPLLDAGIKFILETCSTLFNYAQRHRHLSPYAENPFRTVEVSRIPVEEIRPVVVFSADQERRFLEACDSWQFPLFLTLLLTGLRPGELTHLLLPEDLDLEGGWLYVRNKPQLGWQVKTRNEREIPLVPVLVEVLRAMLAGRTAGPVFRQRRYGENGVWEPPLAELEPRQLQQELVRRARSHEAEMGLPLTRSKSLWIARGVWRDSGGFRTDVIRNEFIRLTDTIGLPHVTAPKTLRHTFATILQDANVDPLIRNELMGHIPAAPVGPSLAMTAVYTHTRPETKRRQLEEAFKDRPAVKQARKWLEERGGLRE